MTGFDWSLLGVFGMEGGGLLPLMTGHRWGGLLAAMTGHPWGCLIPAMTGFDWSSLGGYMANLADQCHVWRSRSNHVGSGAWVAELAVRFNFHLGHSGGSGPSFGGYLAKVAVHPHVFIFFGQNGCSVPP
jgi:hypothetical protein